MGWRMTVYLKALENIIGRIYNNKWCTQSLYMVYIQGESKVCIHPVRRYCISEKLFYSHTSTDCYLTVPLERESDSLAYNHRLSYLIYAITLFCDHHISHETHPRRNESKRVHLISKHESSSPSTLWWQEHNILCRLPAGCDESS